MVDRKTLKELLNYDKNTGVFTWKVEPKSYKNLIGKIAGTLNTKGYRQIKIKGTKYLAHRLAFLYVNDSIPEFVDHIDHEPDNNSWDNLRAIEHKCNTQRRRKKSGFYTSKHKGVHKGKYSWIARIQSQYIGSFSCEKEAARAYNKEAKLRYKYPTLNKIIDD